MQVIKQDEQKEERAQVLEQSVGSSCIRTRIHRESCVGGCRSRGPRQGSFVCKSKLPAQTAPSLTLLLLALASTVAIPQRVAL